MKVLKKEIQSREFKGYTFFETGLVLNLKGTEVGYNTNGYLGVSIDGTRYLIHRLIAELFISPPPTPKSQVNHIDGNRSNNEVSNLEWVTPYQNINHAYYDLGLREKQRKASNLDLPKGITRFPLGNKPFRVVVKRNKKVTTIGYYKQLSEAVKALTNFHEGK